MSFTLHCAQYKHLLWNEQRIKFEDSGGLLFTSKRQIKKAIGQGDGGAHL